MTPHLESRHEGRLRRAREVLITHRSSKPITPLFAPLDPAAVREIAAGIHELGEGAALREVIDQLLFEHAEDPSVRPRVVLGIHEIDPSLTLTLLATCRHPDEYRARALAFQRLGWTSRVEATLEAGLEAFPAAFVLHQLRGDLAWEKEDRERARQAYQAYMKLLRPGRILPGIGRVRGRLEALDRPGAGGLVSEVTVLLGWRRLVLVEEDPFAAGGPGAGPGPSWIAGMMHRVHQLGKRWGWPFGAITAGRPMDQDLARWVADRTATEYLPLDSIARGVWTLAVEGSSRGEAPPESVVALRERDVPVLRLALLASGEERWLDPPELIGALVPEGTPPLLPEPDPVPRTSVTELAGAQFGARPARPAGGFDEEGRARVLAAAQELLGVLEPDHLDGNWLDAIPPDLRLTPVLQQWRGWEWQASGAVTPVTPVPLYRPATVARAFLDGKEALAPLALGAAREETLRELERRLAAGSTVPAPRLLAQDPAFAHLVRTRLADRPAAAALLAGLDEALHPGPVEPQVLPLDGTDLEHLARELERCDDQGRAALLARAVLARYPEDLAARLPSLLDRATAGARRGLLSDPAVLDHPELGEVLRRWIRHHREPGELRIALAHLGSDEEFSALGLPSPRWTAEETDAWIEGLDRRPHLLEERYLSLPGLGPRQRTEMARLLHVHRMRPMGPREELEVPCDAWNYLVDLWQRGPHRGLAFAAMLRVPGAVEREPLLRLAQAPELAPARHDLVTALAVDHRLELALTDHLGALAPVDRQVWEEGFAAWLATELGRGTLAPAVLRAARRQAGAALAPAVAPRLAACPWPTPSLWNDLLQLVRFAPEDGLASRGLRELAGRPGMPGWVADCLA